MDRISRFKSGAIIGPIVVALVAACFVMFAQTSTATAQSRSLLDGPVVRRQLLFRSSKLELAPGLATSFGNLYQRELFVTVTGRYHLTNSFALGLNLNFSPLALDTAAATAGIEINGEENLQFSRQMLLTDFHFSYAPMVGKVSIFGNQFHYDIHLNAGIGVAIQASDNDALSGVNFGPAFGGGVRLFIKDNIALNFDVSDYFFSSADALRDGQQLEERSNHHVLGAITIGIFTPPEVRVSR